MVWIVRLVSVGAEGEEHGTDIMRIARPDDLADLASLGLTLAEGKRLLAGVQREVVAAQARAHAVRRPACRGCGGVCRVKDYRQHAVATPFGQVAVRLPRFRCAGCGATETGVAWPPHARSTPELDRLRARLSALMTYRTAAEVLAQLLPVDAGADPETLRRHTFKVAEGLPTPVAATAVAPAEAIVVTLDSTLIRSCGDGERHLEVRIGNVETATGRRQVFGAVARTDTDPAALIRRGLDAVGCAGGTALTAFTDGCPGLRRILLEAGVDGLPILDWFHLAMRLRPLAQIAGGLACDGPERAAAKAAVVGRSSACAGGCGTARPRMPGSASVASARSCTTSGSSPTVAGPSRRPRAGCGPPYGRWTTTSSGRAIGWSTTASGTTPGCGSARR